MSPLFDNPLFQRFGSRVVISLPYKPKGKRERHVIARCDCGRDDQVRYSDLKRGRGQNCSSCASLKHGMARRGQVSRTFRSWESMKRRCTDPNGNRWEHYGGRGIGYDERWEVFEVFLADMGECPSSNHSLDRIDVDGNYGPDNCRWATAKEQRANQRCNQPEDDYDWSEGDFDA